jgi:Zn-dependent M32 family carboxypeptidase
LSASPYLQLEERFRRIIAVDGTAKLLHWDQRTMMPESGREAVVAGLLRADFRAFLLLTTIGKAFGQLHSTLSETAALPICLATWRRLDCVLFALRCCVSPQLAAAAVGESSSLSAGNL